MSCLKMQDVQQLKKTSSHPLGFSDWFNKCICRSLRGRTDSYQHFNLVSHARPRSFACVCRIDKHTCGCTDRQRSHWRGRTQALCSWSKHHLHEYYKPLTDWLTDCQRVKDAFALSWAGRHVLLPIITGFCRPMWVNPLLHKANPNDCVFCCRWWV